MPVNECRDDIKKEFLILDMLIEIGAIEHAERCLSDVETALGGSADADQRDRVGRLRNFLAGVKAEEKFGGPYSRFDFAHPLVQAVREAMDVALVRRTTLWNDFRQGWLTMDLDGLGFDYIANERDRSNGIMVIECVISHASDGVRRPIRLRIKDDCAMPLAVMMASQYGLELAPLEDAQEGPINDQGPEEAASPVLVPGSPPESVCSNSRNS